MYILPIVMTHDKIVNLKKERREDRRRGDEKRGKRRREEWAGWRRGEQRESPEDDEM